MGAVQEELLERLETAIAAWDGQVSGAFRGLSERVNRAQEQIAVLRQDTQARDAEREALQAVRERVTELESMIAQHDAETTAARDRAAELESSIAQRETEAVVAREQVARIAEENAVLRERLQTADSERVHVEQVADTVTSELTARVAQLERELAAARDVALEHGAVEDGAEEVRSALAAERIRADLLQEQLREAREASSRAVSEQLAAALRDRDEAHQQIVVLRAEADLLRRMNASLSIPVPENATPEAGAPPVSAMDEQGRKRRMGEVLVELGVVTIEQLESALQEQVSAPQRRLGTILVEKGFASEDAVARIVARQLGLAFVHLTSEVVDPAATRVIGGALAARRSCLPIGVSSERVILAMANPLDLITIDDVELASGRPVEPVVATATDLVSAIERYYGEGH